jgi:competence protein ComEA
MLSGIKGHTLLIICSVLIIIILAGLVFTLIKFPHSQAVEIIPPARPAAAAGTVMVSGAVNNPGIYPLRSGDSIANLLQAAGGTLQDADISGLTLNVPAQNEPQEEQKVDLNHAGSWLLEALPGIGKTLAARVITCRETKGRFSSISEITQVDGITDKTYQNIKDYITVTN